VDLGDAVAEKSDKAAKRSECIDENNKKVEEKRIEAEEPDRDGTNGAGCQGGESEVLPMLPSSSWLPYFLFASLLFVFGVGGIEALGSDKSRVILGILADTY
jgi:hypothetical protein